MAAVITVWLALAVPVAAADQGRSRQPTLRVTVTDATGAVIIGAQVTAQPVDESAAPISVVSNGRGEAIFSGLAPGRYRVRGESPGFAPKDLPDVKVGNGDTRRELRLDIAKLAEQIDVGQDARDRAHDPRGNAFSNALTREQIDALPDDPDEMEAALKEMAGPGAVLRVDGFRGGKLPPKAQIRSIRFRRDMLAAENHGGGMVLVDIVTAPGIGPLRGTLDFTFRDRTLNARNAFAPQRGPEQQRNGGLSLNGTLWKNRTSFALTSNMASGFESKTLLAAVPGVTISDVVRRPAERSAFSLRVDHALTKSQTLRGSYQRNANENDNLGVGDFDLPQRAYSQRRRDDLLRFSLNGPLGRSLFADTRLQVRRSSSDAWSASDAPTITVLDAFTAGGAQVSGGRAATEFELATDVDYSRGRHSARGGVLVEGGRYRSDDVRNTTGTFIFPSLDAYRAGRPTTFMRRTGNPLVEFSHVQAGWYLQDDLRVSKALSFSVGVRQEVQTHLDDRVNLAPRAGLTWSPFKSGRTTVRAGGGFFYDWYDPQVYEQTVRVDGTRQQEVVVRNPGYPDPFEGGNVLALPASRILQAQGLKMPRTARVTGGLEQALGSFLRFNATYHLSRGRSALRGRNLNAPEPDGRRPDTSAGNVTQVESTGRFEHNVFVAGANLNLPWHRTFVFLNYVFGRMMNDYDGPFSLPADNFDLAAEWGPSPGDVRHRLSGMMNMNLWGNFKLATSFTAGSGAPYNVTTGYDDNGDTVSSDRPAGVGRNSARGAGRVDLGARLSWTFGFGERSGASAGGPPMIVVRTIGGEQPMGGFSGGAENKRWRFELYVAAQNLLNRTNPLGYSGVMTSPFFGRPTSAAPARKIELGARFGF
jgi:hypothetical protein